MHSSPTAHFHLSCEGCSEFVRSGHFFASLLPSTPTARTGGTVVRRGWHCRSRGQHLGPAGVQPPVEAVDVPGPSSLLPRFVWREKQRIEEFQLLYFQSINGCFFKFHCSPPNYLLWGGKAYENEVTFDGKVLICEYRTIHPPTQNLAKIGRKCWIVFFASPAFDLTPPEPTHSRNPPCHTGVK